MQDVIEYDATPGLHIVAASEGAVAKANAEGKRVHFKFNDVDVLVEPGEAPDTVTERWQRDFDAKSEAYGRKISTPWSTGIPPMA